MYNRAMKRMIIFLLCIMLAALPCAGCAQTADDVWILFVNAKKGDAALISANGKFYLVDTGREENADALVSTLKEYGVDEIEGLFLTHSHNDHTGGLRPLMAAMGDRRSALVAHPAVFESKFDGGEPVGSPVTAEELAPRFDLRLSAEPVWLTEHLVFLLLDERNRLIRMYECQDGAHLADYKEQVGRVLGKMTGYSVECLEAYSLMTGTCGPGRCIFDKLPRTSY